MSNKDLESLIDEALNNIRNDRKVAREFLNEIANQIAADAEQNKYLSPVAAKHIETLQRSNEQLVKLIGLRQKDKDKSSLLSDEDKHSLFDLIQGDSNAS
jgi:ABC-type lipoprotein release transport system permease subunit